MSSAGATRMVRRSTCPCRRSSRLLVVSVPSLSWPVSRLGAATPSSRSDGPGVAPGPSPWRGRPRRPETPARPWCGRVGGAAPGMVSRLQHLEDHQVPRRYGIALVSPVLLDCCAQARAGQGATRPRSRSTRRAPGHPPPPSSPQVNLTAPFLDEDGLETLGVLTRTSGSQSQGLFSRSSTPSEMSPSSSCGRWRRAPGEGDVRLGRTASGVGCCPVGMPGGDVGAWFSRRGGGVGR